MPKNEKKAKIREENYYIRNNRNIFKKSRFFRKMTFFLIFSEKIEIFERLKKKPKNGISQNRYQKLIFGFGKGIFGNKLVTLKVLIIKELILPLPKYQKKAIISFRQGKNYKSEKTTLKNYFFLLKTQVRKF